MDEEADIDPFKMVFLQENEQNDDVFSSTALGGGAPSSEQQLMQQHFIRSMESTLLIRQLPSEGLAFKLWPAATSLVTLLDNYRCHPSNCPLTPILTNLVGNRQLSILELGSGTGLVGMAAAAVLGARVTVTDLPHVIPNLKYNVDANAGLISRQGGVVYAAPLRWGEGADMEVMGREFDLVLASDVVYHDHLYEPLVETLRFLLLGSGKKEMVFVMAHLRRWKKESVFFNKAKKLFNVRKVHVDRPCHGARTGVVVYCMNAKTKKCKKDQNQILAC